MVMVPVMVSWSLFARLAAVKVFSAIMVPASEATVQEPGLPVITKVDAGKLSHCQLKVDRAVGQPRA